MCFIQVQNVFLPGNLETSDALGMKVTIQFR